MELPMAWFTQGYCLSFDLWGLRATSDTWTQGQYDPY